MKYRNSRYTSVFKVRVLTALDAGGKRHWRQVEREFDVPLSTLRGWYRRREQIMEEAREAQYPRRVAIDAHFAILTQQLLNSLPEKIESAKLTDSIRALTMLNELHPVFQNKAEAEDPSAIYERVSKVLDRYRLARAEREKTEPVSTSAQED